MNPYDFVPLGEPSPRGKPPGHAVLATRAGTIHARLTTLGPFLIAQQAAAQNTIIPVGQGKIIPGSSLKGMLRSMAEMIGGGCISLSGNLYRRGAYSYTAAQEPQDFRPCDRIDELCVTCRMFGALIGRDVWKGLVEPGEGRWTGTGAPRTKSFNVIVGQPKPSHDAFYAKDRKIRGRKAYYHHPDKILESAPAQHVAYGARQTIVVRALERGQTYEFRVRHEGLDQVAYELLLYALFLEDGLAHKLGWGKPMGFGSVKIEPIAVQEVDLWARYRRGGDRAAVQHEEADALAYVRERTKELRARTGDAMEAVRRMFAHPGPSESWAYPTYSWFREHPTVTLEEFNSESAGRRRSHIDE